MNANKKRETFSSPLTTFFVTLGSAVGIGNIWKFPYMVGSNGGGIFLLIYIIFILLIGLPIMIAEFYIGRSTKRSPISAFTQISKKYKIIGYLYVISTYLVLFFYTTVAGWIYLYVFKALSGEFINLNTKMSSDIFNSATIGPFTPIMSQIVVILTVGIIISLGVKNGIEKINKILMPVLFLLLIIIAIRGLTLEGAQEGLSFLFNPDFSKTTNQTIVLAMGLAFFKLSIAMGPVITYASYFKNDTNLIKTGVSVALSDTIVSILAGIAIFPVVFTFGIEPGAGSGLLFITIPLVFSKIVFGEVLLVLFFILVAIAATGALISLVEVTVADIMERLKLSRLRGVILSSSIVLICGVLSTLSYNSESIFGSIIVPMLGTNIFNGYDSISSNLIMPIGGLLTALVVGYKVNKEDLYNELSNNGNLKIKNIYNVFFILLRYITPILVILVIINSIGLFRK